MRLKLKLHNSVNPSVRRGQLGFGLILSELATHWGGFIICSVRWQGGRRVAGVLALFVGSERFAVSWLYRPGQSLSQQ